MLKQRAVLLILPRTTTAEPRTVGDGSAVAVELLIADDPSAKSAEEAATELAMAFPQQRAGRWAYRVGQRREHAAAQRPY